MSKIFFSLSFASTRKKKNRTQPVSIRSAKSGGVAISHKVTVFFFSFQRPAVPVESGCVGFCCCAKRRTRHCSAQSRVSPERKDLGRCVNGATNGSS